MNCPPRNLLLRTLEIVFIASVASAQMAAGQIETTVESVLVVCPERSSYHKSPAGIIDGQAYSRESLRPKLILNLASEQPRFEIRGRSGSYLSADRVEITNVIQGEFRYNQSSLGGERIEPSLLEDVGRFDKSHGWQIGGGGLFTYGFRNLASRLIVHCGPGFKSPRESFEGERCFGLLLRFEIGKRKQVH